ncbi:MAG: S41 family peptidase [Aureliella sp.]
MLSTRFVSRLAGMAWAIGMLGLGPAFVHGQTSPSAGMLRYPDISQSEIVFCYADDLWIVAKDGGMAFPLASPEGHELYPKFSPDGTKIAFVGNYEGGSDLYEIPVAGGIAKRMTYHPGRETLCGYAGNDSLIYSSSSFAKLGRMAQLFTISEEQPVPVQVNVPYGTNGTIHPDGEWLAYTPYSRDTRTWKRYRGGMASDVWLFNLKTHESKQVTDWEGTDSYPMWHGDRLYYLSDDGAEHRLNIWSYDMDSGKSTQVTKFRSFDVKYPSIGPGSKGEGEIVFQLGSELRILNLKSKKSKSITVSIPGDRPTLRPEIVDASDFITGASISPSAKRVAVAARGDIWTAPAKNGSPRNLTRTSGVAERDPAWSPDGRWVAYFSDESGEYELTVTQSDGQGETKQLTKGGGLFRFSPSWSPDSKKVFFYDKGGNMFVHDLEKEKTKKFDQDPYSTGPSISWSHDSKWLAYSRNHDKVARSQIRLLNTETGKTTAVTSGYFNDTDPAFDREGDYLYFASSRDFSSPKYEDLGTTFIYDETQVLVALPLRKDVKNPLLPTSDEQEWEDEDEEGDEDDEDSKDAGSKPGKKASDSKSKDASAKGESRSKGSKAKKKKERKKGRGRKKPASDAKSKKDESKENEAGDKGDDDDSGEEEELEIDLEDMEARCFQIPVAAGNFSSLAVSGDGALIYGRTASKGESGQRGIKRLTMEDGKADEQSVVDGALGFELTADGKQMLVFARGNVYILKPASGQKLTSSVSTDGMEMEIDRRAEWEQIFHDAWRIERDFFYDPNMHGVDWEAVRDQYAEMLDDCVSRQDLSYIIREMISELNVGHAYYRETQLETGPRMGVGMLGCSFEIDGEQVKFGELWRGGAWDVDARNPLAAVGIKSGDVLVSVEGVSVDASVSPYKYFVGKTGRSISIEVKSGKDDVRTVAVKPIGSDSQLRFWDGIEEARAYVDKKSKGKVGYIYVTNTGINGQNDLFRQFYSQQEKAALIIDDRWNGGGQIPTRFIELLNRPVTNYWARRDGTDWVWPPDSHQGPKCMLINGLAGSGGDMFPGLFKQMKLGKLIGRRTWGGLVGIQGEPPMIDGSSVTAPSFAYYETDGTWGIEGHGVDPDIEVIDDPAKMVDGGDPQLDAAIAQMLKEIKKYPKPPKRPAYPDRSGMGLPDADK